MNLLYKQLFWKKMLIGFSIFFLTGLSAFGQEPYSFNHKVINWGLKVGLNANAMMSLHVMYEGEEVTDVSFQNKTGIDICSFFRINLSRFFIQPELGWTRLNKDIEFSFLAEENAQQSVELSFESQTFNMNGLVGYNITKRGPYVFNVMVGSSLHYRFNARYTVPIYDLYGVIGFSMNISNVHFDIRYALNVLSRDIRFNNPDWLEGIRIRKNENILSFSCGVMF